jgi:hypothetical protein
MILKLKGDPHRLVLTIRFPFLIRVPATDVVEAISAYTGPGGKAEVHGPGRKRRHSLRQTLLRRERRRYPLDHTDYEIRSPHHVSSGHGWSMMS